VDSQCIKKRADAKAASYDVHSYVTRLVADRLLQRLDYIKCTPARILDLGAGTGYVSSELQKRYADADVFAVDFSQQRLRLASGHALCADAHAIPFCDHSMDMIIANLSLHWMAHLPMVLAEVARVLKPEGVFMLTMPGSDTLKELKAACVAEGLSLSVHDFMDMHDLGDELVQAGFNDPVIDREIIQIAYDAPGDFFADLKKTGSTNARKDRMRGLLTPARWARVTERLPSELMVTLELVQAQAWKIQPKGFRENDKGEVVIPLSSLRA
jgi:malonyl-CoA O-methyltransferase